MRGCPVVKSSFEAFRKAGGGASNLSSGDLMRNRFAVFVLLSLAWGGWLRAADRAGTVTILTQNMDAGTDQSYIVAASLNLVPLSVAQAVDLTAQEIHVSNIPQRAQVLAAKIAATKPDLVALQEVS